MNSERQGDALGRAARYGGYALILALAALFVPGAADLRSAR
jgi:hypothetical protein